ncbi:MAG: pyridoxine 5'-phosphate synthase [Candidatus Margulisiibacteriota bacterium]
MTRLGVNIDHIATLRQQRKEGNPNLIEAAKWAIEGGADNITIHLREDRRHIQDQDVFDLKPIANELNFECATAPEIIDIATKIKPEWTCIVPEKREELTTEGGLNLSQNTRQLKETIKKLQDHGILVSLFINPQLNDINISKDLGANGIEIHTGIYALAPNKRQALHDIQQSALLAHQLGLKVQAGHGLNYENITPVTKINEIEEVNIGHSIISRSIEIGLKSAVQLMKSLI